MKHNFHDDNLDHFFKVEIENEVHGGVSPATLNSAIDSLTQASDDVIAAWFNGEPISGLVAFARLLSIMPGAREIELRDFVA